MKGKVLITQGVRLFALRVGQLLGDQFDVFFGTADEIPSVLLQQERYLKLPSHTHAAFEHELLRICLDNAIDTVIPLGESEIALLGSAVPLFAEYGISIWAPHGSRLGALTLLRDPDRRFTPVVVDRGRVVAGNMQSPEFAHTLSGVFAQVEAANEMALCCVVD